MSSALRLALAIAATSASIVSLPAQRPLDLTGKPAAALGEPFTRITGIRETSTGQLIVTDPMERGIFAVDMARGTRRQIANPGEGPNEFRFPGTPVAGPGDTTWIPDVSLGRLHKVTGAGIVGSIRIPPALASFSALRGVDAQGRLYLQGSKFDSERGTFPDSVAITRWDPKSGSTETLGRVWSGGRVVLTGKDGQRSSVDRASSPFPHVDNWIPLPDGSVAVVQHAPYRIDLITAPGKIVPGKPLGDPARPLTAKDRADFRETQSRVRIGATGRAGTPQGPPRALTEYADTDFPKTLPPFRGDAVLATPEGEIWIGRTSSASDPTVIYDIHDTKGTLVARATLKRHSTVVGFGKGVVYVARQDPDDDLLYLEKYRR